MENRIPKPTHHLMIPLPEDIDNEKKQMDEQESIILFAKEFLTDIQAIDSSFRTDKLYLTKDIFSELIWSIEKSQDKEHNLNTFKDRGEYLKKEREEYHNIKQKKTNNRIL